MHEFTVVAAVAIILFAIAALSGARPPSLEKVLAFLEAHSRVAGIIILALAGAYLLLAVRP